MNTFIEYIEPLMKLSMLLMLGLYFTFSNTVMNALKNLESGALVMIEINEVILNPTFMISFFSSAISAIYFALTQEGYVAISGWVFFIGTFVVTLLRNVPLNNKLKDSKENNEVRTQMWALYLSKWVFWNHIRTIAALTSGLLLVL